MLRSFILCLALLAGCYGTPTRQIDTTPVPAVEAISNTAYVVVKNQSWSMVRIYVTENGTARRIGSVESFRTERLSFAVANNSRVSFIVSPLASNSPFVTEEIGVVVGATLHLNVQEPIRFTTVYAGQ